MANCHQLCCNTPLILFRVASYFLFLPRHRLSHRSGRLVPGWARYGRKAANDGCLPGSRKGKNPGGRKLDHGSSVREPGGGPRLPSGRRGAEEKGSGRGRGERGGDGPGDPGDELLGEDGPGRGRHRIPPKSVTKVPVSCVEQGRWNYRGKNFQPSPHHAAHSIRKMNVMGGGPES